ncbi:hypothetical protein OBBRIDRAFT_144065 [Obba rivulosa]|uniref:Uncharacterized protein n=1 Tax=Obba rivulosa TaxID=1052685 RepID=A0A8E2DRG3_9APHY|nr:hypothetical protein OBBRIDRAFT_144065 [Obba rivulosa]
MQHSQATVYHSSPLSSLKLSHVRVYHSDSMSPVKEHLILCLPAHFLEVFKRDEHLCLPDSSAMCTQYQLWRSNVLSAGLSPDTPIPCCTTSKDLTSSPEVISMMEEVHGDDPDGNGRTMLHIACIEGDLPSARETIRLGVNVDSYDNGGETPLVTACRWYRSHIQIGEGKTEMICATAVALGSNPYTPQFCAPIISLLVAQHTDVNIKFQGETPLSIICETRDWPLTQLLIDTVLTSTAMALLFYPCHTTRQLIGSGSWNLLVPTSLQDRVPLGLAHAGLENRSLAVMGLIHSLASAGKCGRMDRAAASVA